VGLSAGRSSQILVRYQDSMQLSIPRSATETVDSFPVSKLTLAALNELIDTAKQCEPLCRILPPPSGPDSAPNSNNK